ncbi:penicillin amidase domain-containing [Cystoisospora suis]|uniref:Penicillin amidase domain-containing n=1 Tax=Cystoisospora suis TaxID=483139 RepID=A0A2C6LBV2_9APIC|nr:penicillin amidase domain-containing [Cystoisospora suis]
MGGVVATSLIVSLIGTVFLILAASYNYANTQHPLYRSDNLLVDFLSYSLSFVTRPLIRHFFTIPETFWNSDQQLAGLKDAVDVYRDKYGVPYIFAHNRRDADCVQAYLEYTERPFQLEFLRRAASGQLAASLGDDLVGADHISRLLVDSELMERKLAELPPAAQELIGGLAQCWNEAAAHLPATPIEFNILGWEPYSQWEALDVMRISTVFSLLLNRGFTIDFCRAILKKELGEYWEAFDTRVQPDVPPLNSEGFRPSLFDQNGNRIQLPPLPKRDERWAKVRPGDLKLPTAAVKKDAVDEGVSNGTGTGSRNHTRSSLPKWGGSNSWAISGRYTSSGRPILAGDPHLEATAPSFWLPLFRSVGPSSLLTTHRRTKPSEDDATPSRVVGADAVGFATIFVGHNGHSAWSQTVAHTDIEDLYLVKLDSTGKKYLYDGAWHPLRIRVEEIHIRGHTEPIRKTVRFTHHGPIVSDVYEELRGILDKDEALAFASVAMRAPPAIDFGPGLNYAKTWKDLVKLGSHCQQFEFVTVWATSEGDIGAAVTGGVPIRPPAEARGGSLRNGSSSVGDWNGLLPAEKMPQIMNPKDGFVATANCRVADDPDELLGEVFVPGNRIQRIRKRLRELTAEKKVTVEDMIGLQSDVQSVNGQAFAEYVMAEVLFAYDATRALNGKQTAPDGASAEQVRQSCSKEGVTLEDGKMLAEQFTNWDGNMSVESVSATLYEVWIQWLLQDIFKMHGFSDYALHIAVGGGFHPIWLPRTEMLNHWRGNILRAMQQKKKLITDIGTPRQLLCKSAASALDWLRLRYGKAPEAWVWGSVRARFIEHVLGGAVPILRHTASVGPIRWGGNFGTIKAHHNEPHVLSKDDPRSSQYTKGLDTPTFRLVVDTGNFTNSYWSFTPGVSGWIGSKHYDDLASSIAGGEEYMLPMLWTDEQIKAAAVTHMRFLPRVEGNGEAGQHGRPNVQEEL